MGFFPYIPDYCPNSLTFSFVYVDIENMKHFEAYQQALKDGEVVAMYYVKLILFGPPLSGKSSTRKRLLKEIENLQKIGDKTASTGFADVTEVLLKRQECNEKSNEVPTKVLTSTPAAIFKADDGKWEWETVKCSKTNQHEDLRYIAKICYTIINNVSKGVVEQKQVTSNPSNTNSSGPKQVIDESDFVSDFNQTTDKGNHIPHPEQWTVEGNDHDVFDPTSMTIDYMNTNATSTTEFKAVEQAFQSLQSTLVTHNIAEFQRLIINLIMVNMIDVGGQQAFLEMLPTLTIGSALYLLFFRMDHDLQELRMAEFRSDKDDKVITLKRSEYSIEDVLCQGLSTVASFGCTQQCDISLSNAKPKDIHKCGSHALLVGTYKDKVEDLTRCISNVNDLWKKLDEINEDLLLPADESNSENFFQVDNMTGNDSIAEMRQKISRYLSKKYTGWDIPATWLIFRIIIQLMDKPVVTIRECEMVANKLNMLASMKEALWFLHHQIGCLMYYPKIPSLEDIIICNPQAVFDMISKVVIERFNCEDMDRKFVKCFKERGEFTITMIDGSSQENAKYYLTIEQLVDLMTYHRVIAKISPGKYIMPSVLKCTSKKDIEQLLKKGIIHPLKLKFICNYVPIGIFCGVVSLLIARRKSNGWSLPENYVLNKNQIRFSVGEAYHVDFVAQPLYLGIQVTCPELATKHRKPEIEICSSVKKTVDRALKDFISQMKYKDPRLASELEKLPYDPAFDCICGNSGHLMKVCGDSEKRKGKCTSGIAYDLEDKHLVWFGEVSFNDTR